MCIVVDRLKTDSLLLLQLRQSYGNVYSIFFGLKPVVMINGFQAMREAMIVKAVDFAGRPQDMFMNDVIQRKGKLCF